LTLTKKMRRNAPPEGKWCVTLSLTHPTVITTVITEVELLIQSPQVVSPPISVAETKQRFLKSLIERMQQNPIPPNAPHFTREMLHERR
jgi:hypothetical protein